MAQRQAWDLNAAEIKALTGWPDPIIESFLEISSGLATVTNQVDVELTEIVNQITTIVEAGSSDINRARLMTLSRRFQQLQKDIDELISGQASLEELLAGLNQSTFDPRLKKIKRIIVDIVEDNAGMLSQIGSLSARIGTLDNSMDSRIAARVSLGN